MTASSLGTVLIQRIDAALGNAGSTQTSLARSATDAVRQPAQADKGQNTTNQVQRDQRENVDRAALQQVQSGKGKGVDRAAAQALARGNLPAGFTTTSVNTTLGSAAKIILQLFANHNFGSTPLQGRQPLINQAPNNTSNTTGNASNSAQGNNSNLNLGNQNLSPAQVARAQTLINTITNSNQNIISNRLTQAINAAYKSEGAPNNQLSAQIARSLAQNISQSGLFYESHIKAYNNGLFKLADIRQEPQNQTHARSTAATNTANNATQSPVSGNQNNPATNLANTNTTQPTNIATNNPNINAAANANLANAPTTPGVDPSTHNIVRQQLEVLADQSIQWRGEAWPGTEMQWRIHRNHEENQHQDQSLNMEQAQWQTSLKLKLPKLGHINANIGVNGNKIFLNLQAQSDQIENLQTNSNQLIQHLLDRQLQLMQLKLDAFEAETTISDNLDNNATQQDD